EHTTIMELRVHTRTLHLLAMVARCQLCPNPMQRCINHSLTRCIVPDRLSPECGIRNAECCTQPYHHRQPHHQPAPTTPHAPLAGDEPMPCPGPGPVPGPPSPASAAAHTLPHTHAHTY